MVELPSASEVLALKIAEKAVFHELFAG
jgi:hypothetical protein